MSKFETLLALEASAGSGKTYALSVRYISLLYLGAKPSKILTLTFTNKAAAEMKSRIYDTIKNLEHKDELVSISEQVGVSCEELLERKAEILKSFLKDDLLISTIDSFFAGILRKFALNAGFMPDFKIETNLLQTELLEKFLRLCIQEKKYNSLIKFSINEENKLADIFSLLDDFYDKESELDPKMFSKMPHVKPDIVLNILEELASLFEKEGASESVLKTFRADDIQSLMKKGFLQKDSLEYWQYKKHITPQINELFDELKEKLEFYLNAREKYLLGELAELYALYKQSLRSLNKELSTLSFADVTNAIFSLLRDEISKEFLYFRLDGKIDHILIDEFQDTNVMQYKILEPLMSEISSGVGVKEFKSLFFVGDVKQSIYRFRGGAKELFSHAVKQFNVKKEVLDSNYRSCKNVVEYVNAVFSKQINGYEIQKVKKEKEGYVEVILGDEVLPHVLEKTKFLLDCGVAEGDIAILVHKNSDAQEIKVALLDHVAGIHVQTEASIKLIRVTIIAAIIDVLKYAYFKDAIYKHNFLVVFGEDWRDDLDLSWLHLNATPAQLITSIVKKYKLFDNDVDIIKLVEISERYADIESFLFECDEFNDDAKAQDNNGIKILTIHKSKGLEFHHVIVADRLGGANNRSGTLLYEYDDINLTGIYQRVTAREFIDEKYKVAKDKEILLSLQDVTNMHYVAFTRAKDSLIICAKESKSVFEYLNLQEHLLGEVSIKEKGKKEVAALLEMSQNLQAFGQQKTSKTSDNKEGETDFYAIEYGLAMHYLLEMMGGFDKKSLDGAYVSMFNKYSITLSEVQLSGIYTRVEKLLVHEEFLALIKNGKLYKEQPIAYKGERKQIDLLVDKEDEVIIIDYKSSLHVSDSHVAQIGLYKQAIESIYSKKVSSYLCYVRENGIILVNN
jgi:ATP-dependent exoDNAse (exonuclease V) beta subunit